MAISSQTSPIVSSTKRATSAAGRYFYFGMSLLIAAVVIYGFSHTVDQNLIHGKPARPWLLWVHGTLFSAWVAFFIMQSGLVRTHNVRVHRRLGWVGAGLAVAMTLVGIATAVVMRRFDMRFEPADVAGPPAFLIIPLWDIACFTVFFWLAVNWRKKPEMHRRLMLIATCALTAAAWGRLPNQTFANVWFYSGVDALILLGVARDLLVMKSVHRVYWYALPALVVGQVSVMRTLLTTAPWWTRIANAILR
jgi:FtsH-binding integral membrane protein